MLQKVIGCLLLILGIGLIIGQFGYGIYIENQYKNEIENYWSLSEKASTIEAKSDYMDKFVSALDNSGVHGNNAVFLKNPDNNFDQNLVVLKTLQNRLHDIKKMNETSFEYQQAISQITAQEQGEAQNMLEVFRGTWYLQLHSWLWGWIAISWLIFELLIAICGVGLIMVDDD